MTGWRGLSGIRRDYGELSLSDADACDCPLTQFEHWFSDVLESEKTDPTAMVLSTVDDDGHPDSRVVLLKEIKDGCFIFYTNYQSVKSQHLSKNPYVALNFYWPEMARQVRIRGQAKRASAEQSDAYFSSRPMASQLSAIASPQSKAITSRSSLEQTLNELMAKQATQPVIRPNHWGGFVVSPEEFEFWQGRDNRLHDRIHYYCQKGGQWVHRRLAP